MDYSYLVNAVESVAGGAIGGSTAVLGLSRWLGDVWLGRLLEKEKARYAVEIEKLRAGFAQELEHYRAQLDRSIFVTRAHFETEFTAKDVSQCLSAVKIAFLKLEPIALHSSSIVDIDREGQVEALLKANHDFKQKLEEWAVFLEPAMYDEFDRCHMGADEAANHNKNIPDEPDRAGSVTYFWRHYRQACQLVRDRIKVLAVMPRS